MKRAVVREGIIAGLIGAATVAVWFLIFDLIQLAPLRTPALLWATLFQGVRDPAAVSPALLPVLAYTAAHVLVFIVIGIVAAFLVAGAEREPAMLLALVIFFAAFEIFFLALIVFLARPLLGVLHWWAILIGNFLAAVGMLGYFFAGHRPLARTLLGRWVGVIREGLLAGLIGAAVVALWFLIYDTLAFQPLRTPSLLGAAIFEGLRDPKLLEIRLDLALGYTVLHVAAFAFFGVLAAALLVAAEREPRILLGLFILFWCFELFFLGFVSALDEALVGALLWWNVAIANLLAAVAMITYFFLGHRSLGGRLLERWHED
ncbi:MAG TPA: hypothetical protein VGW35_15935 [Methylomirabilota bacterium]|jgi:hypothetical protein|nr:hypothetical protein [Methylomirabilota bacterium]